MALGFCDGEIAVPQRTNDGLRFLMLVACMFSALATGAIYSFSLISGKMTSDYGFNQNDLTTVSTVGIVVGYFTLPFGVIFDYFGPKPIFVIGVVTYVIGSLLFALTFEGVIGHSVVSLSVINAVMNVGCAQFDIGSILSIMSWFPLDRGLVVASAKTMTGLGGSVVATIYNTYFSGKHSQYMYFLMGLVVVIGGMCFVLIHLPPYHMTGWRIKHYTEEDRQLAARFEHVYLSQRASRTRFYVLLAIVIALLITITTQSIVFVFMDSVTKATRNPPAIVMIVLFALLFVAVLPLPWYRRKAARSADANGPMAGEMEPLESSAEPTAEGNSAPDDAARKGGNKKGNADESCADGEEPPVETLLRHEDCNFPQYPTGFVYNALRRPELWCLWVNALFVSGGVHVVLLNSREIYVAVSETTDDEQLPALYVALTSVGNALGRLIVSFYETYNQSKPLDQRTPITVAYCVPSVLMCLSAVLFLVLPAKGLLVPMVLGGLANGGYAGSLVLTMRTVFSIDIAKHYNSVFFFDLLAVIIFNRFLFGELMTRNSTTDPVSGATRCLGRKRCIQTTFIVIAALSVLAFVASLIMHIRYTRYARRKLEEFRNGRQGELGAEDGATVDAEAEAEVEVKTPLQDEVASERVPSPQDDAQRGGQ